MKRLMMAAVVACTVMVPTMAFACDGSEHQASAAPKTLTVAELAALTKSHKATPVDANGKETREKQGVIPGAVLLTSSSQFDASKELPKDKASQLVFYCAGVRCQASHGAAQRAMEAGYTNVAVMPEGISGWKQAGQPTQKPNS